MQEPLANFLTNCSDILGHELSSSAILVGPLSTLPSIEVVQIVALIEDLYPEKTSSVDIYELLLTKYNSPSVEDLFSLVSSL